MISNRVLTAPQPVRHWHAVCSYNEEKIDRIFPTIHAFILPFQILKHSLVRYVLYLALLTSAFPKILKGK